MNCEKKCFHRTKEVKPFDLKLGYRVVEEKCCGCDETRQVKDSTPEVLGHKSH